MTASDRFETSRMPCFCGRGEFVFYTCQYDGWSYVNNPDVEWYEMHIFCDICYSDFSNYKPTQLMQSGEQVCWRIKIPEPEKIPEQK